MEKPQDKQPKKLTKEQEQQQFRQQVIAYVNDHLLQVIQQVRATAMAAGVTPEQFYKAFHDEAGLDKFYLDLHALENPPKEDLLGGNGEPIKN